VQLEPGAQVHNACPLVYAVFLHQIVEQVMHADSFDGQTRELAGHDFTHPAFEQPLGVGVQRAAARLAEGLPVAVILQPPDTARW